MRKPSANQSTSTPQRLVVLGGGESGVGAAMLGIQKGWTVFVSDYGAIKSEYKADLRRMDIPFEENQHTETSILNADIIVKSPGIPDKAPIIKKIIAKGIPVISEIEWAYRFLEKGTVIAITGSNGKTTTASLIYHLLNEAGLEVALGGNIGYSFAKILAEGTHDYYVLEISSFQLDGIQDFKPDISILLNITPDHLDRYDYKVENYAKAKFRIIENQAPGDHFILNEDDKTMTEMLKAMNVKPRLHRVSTGNYLDGFALNDLEFSEEDLTIKGPHNFFNASCAAIAATLVGIRGTSIKKALKTFKNVPHRLELVDKIKGVAYVNDSKATNVDAVFHALKAMKTPTVWIVGGTDKGNEYEPVFDLVEEKVKAIVCLGVDNSKILEAFSTKIKIIEETNSAQEAVRVAAKYAEPGDTVLLSPACASFDLFKNYEDRGDQFKNAVLRLRD